jgi:hypothetical protein
MARIIGRVPFTEGIERDVYEDAEGRQYVYGDEGKVHGTWLPPTDEPNVLEIGKEHHQA